MNLGALLAQTKDEEELNTRAAALRKAEAASAEELEKYKLVEEFFNTAKVFFSQGILERLPTKDLHLVVGTKDIGKSYHWKVYDALALYQSQETPRVTKKTHAFYPLWSDFEAWASTNGLQPVWRYCHDGCGMYSWFELRVEPKA
jgi:hypothetical protein